MKFNHHMDELNRKFEITEIETCLDLARFFDEKDCYGWVKQMNEKFQFSLFFVLSELEISTINNWFLTYPRTGKLVEFIPFIKHWDSVETGFTITGELSDCLFYGRRAFIIGVHATPVTYNTSVNSRTIAEAMVQCSDTLCYDTNKKTLPTLFHVFAYIRGFTKFVNIDSLKMFWNNARNTTSTNNGIGRDSVIDLVTTVLDNVVVPVDNDSEYNYQPNLGAIDITSENILGMSQGIYSVVKPSLRNWLIEGAINNDVTMYLLFEPLKMEFYDTVFSDNDSQITLKALNNVQIYGCFSFGHVCAHIEHMGHPVLCVCITFSVLSDLKRPNFYTLMAFESIFNELTDAFYPYEKMHGRRLYMSDLTFLSCKLNRRTVNSDLDDFARLWERLWNAKERGVELIRNQSTFVMPQQPDPTSDIFPTIHDKDNNSSNQDIVHGFRLTTTKYVDPETLIKWMMTSTKMLVRVSSRQPTVSIDPEHTKYTIDMQLTTRANGKNCICSDTELKISEELTYLITHCMKTQNIERYSLEEYMETRESIWHVNAVSDTEYNGEN